MLDWKLGNLFMTKRKKRKKKRKTKNLDTSISAKIEREKYLSEIAQPYEAICLEINSHITAASHLVSQLDPLKLLQRGFGEYAALSLGKMTEVEITDTEGIARRMIDYLQCLIVATPQSEIKVELTTEVWEELKSHVEAIFTTLFSYFISASARDQLAGDYDDEWAEFFAKAQMTWCYVKGDRHINHLAAHLNSLLQPHDHIFIELFGITVAQFIDELGKIQMALTRGLFDAVIEIREVYDLVIGELQAEYEQTDDMEAVGKLLQQKLNELGEQDKLDAGLGKFIGLDLYDLSIVTNLPANLLAELSLSPGEDSAFLANENRFSGWPLALWPTWNKPFLHVDGKYYCFDMYVLSDKVYRAIQKVIYRLKPSYRNLWSTGQQLASEKIPIQLFQKLLPNLTVYQNVFYKWSTSGTKRDWVECDSLLIYDDHLFVVEVKGGAFTYTPPTTDAPAHIKSMKSLLLKPAEQGQRFVDYLNSADKVAIFNEAHDQVGVLQRDAFRHITICCVTVDQLTHLAAKATDLPLVGKGLTQKNIWHVSIDDLRVYADIFTNPIQFLHFIEQRLSANSSDLVQLEDELEHLGLYLSQNRYVQFADEMVRSKRWQPDHIVWSGFTSEIDKFYSIQLAEGNPPLPSQSLPDLFQQIITFLMSEAKYQHTFAGSKLLDLSTDAKERLTAMVWESLRLTRLTQRPRPFLMSGDTCISVYCHIDVVQDDAIDIIAYGEANLSMTTFQDSLVLELFFDSNDKLIDADFSIVEQDEVPRVDNSGVAEYAEQLSSQRLEKRMEQGKIGRNEICPCGSGRKYKTCHGRAQLK